MKRRALATSELMVIVASALLVVGVSVVVTPRIIRGEAGSKSTETSSKSVWPAELQSAVSALAVLFSESSATLSMVPCDDSRDEIEFIALWMGDTQDSNQVHYSEVIVLRHSRLLRSVAAYAWEAKSPLDEDRSCDPERFTRAEIERMLSEPSTSSRVIGVNVDWKVIETVRSEKSSGTESAGGIQLTWRSQSADSEIVARVPTRMPPRVATH